MIIAHGAPSDTDRLGFSVPGRFGRLRSECAAAAVEGANRPPAADDQPPSWLRSDQVRTFRAALGIARALGGVMIATPVGSGKTYTGLAVCRALDPSTPVALVVPGILIPQWQRAALDLGAACTTTSHELISRGGRIAERGPVLIDESHRFRNPGTRRYRELAPQLLGRPVVLLTATPVVNRRRDLTAQLALAVRDDALMLYGTPSVHRAVEDGEARIATLIVRTNGPSELPSRRESVIRQWHTADRWFARTVERIDRLKLSPNRPIAALIRNSLLRALASSPSALLASLDRYRRLLGHAADARRAGHPINRSTIRSIVAGDVEQLVMWDLLEPAQASADLAAGDLTLVNRLALQVRHWIAHGDSKTTRLAATLADGRPTLVFATFTETVHQLRQHLSGPGVAWLTGSEAGYQQRRMPRSLVVQSFDPVARANRRLPTTTVLLATDVAAEGLNLRSAARVVHYDLPWTPIRLEQRDGRAVRPGSAHPDVEVVRFELPAPIEARIRIEHVLQQKRAISQTHPAAATDDGQNRTGWCMTAEGDTTALFRLRDVSSGATGLVTLARSPGGHWREVPDRPLRWQFIDEGSLPPAEFLDLTASLDAPVRQAIARITTARLGGFPVEAAALAYLRTAAGCCHRARDLEGLARAESVMRFLRRGHTAAEAMLVDRIGRGDRAAFDQAARIGSQEADRATLIAELLVLSVPARR